MKEVFFHRDICSWGGVLCHSTWTNWLNAHHLLQDCICVIILWVYSLWRNCGWVMSPWRNATRRHVAHYCIYIPHQRDIKKSSQCGFNSFYGRQTLCCLVNRRRWLRESSWILCKINLHIFFLWVSSVCRLNAWVCDLPYNNPPQSLPELGCGKRRCTWLFSPSCS